MSSKNFVEITEEKTHEFENIFIYYSNILNLIFFLLITLHMHIQICLLLPIPYFQRSSGNFI